MKIFKITSITTLLLFSLSLKASVQSTWENLNQKYKMKSNNQSYCIENYQGVQGDNLDKTMRPASVSKLYTTYWALKKLGSDYQFKTKFFYDQDSKSLFIEHGNDPFFVSEILLKVITHLNHNYGVSSLNEIIIRKGLALNWKKDESYIRDTVYRLFNTRRWLEEDRELYNDLNQSFAGIKSFKLNKVSFNNFEIPNPSFTFYSSPIHYHLKEINVYSNNFYTDELFHFLGGSDEFHKFIYSELNTTSVELYFYTGSGLGDNYTTCRVTLNLLDRLETLIRDSNLTLQDLISVAGVDDGTLDKRFKKQSSKNKVIAKTGTLNSTTSLAGYLGNSSTRFVIFNSTYRLPESRSLQDEFIEYLIKNFKITQRFNYTRRSYNPLKEAFIE